MDLSDEQLVLMTWKVAVRKGWGFVVKTLLRGGVEVFSPGFGGGRGQGSWGKFGDWSEQDLVPADSPMVSQESGDEEEEMTVMDRPCLNSMEWPSWSGQCPSCCAHTPSSREEPPVLSIKRKYQSETCSYFKIRQFIDEVTRVFHDYFSGIEMPDGKPALTACESTHPESRRGLPGLSTGTWAKRSSKNEQTQTPSCDASCVPVEQLPTDATPRASPQALQVALVRAIARLPPVAVTKSVPLAPAGLTEEFPCARPLAAHVPMQLRETVRSLRFFDMFSLLQGQSTEHLVQKEDVIDRTLVNWQRAFEVMGSILLEDAPEKMKRFFNYSATIRKIHDQLPDGAWHSYDQLFRKLKEAHPDMSWAVVHPQLWQQVSKPVQHPHGEKAVGKTCQLYNEDKCEQADLCHFAHLCSQCRGKHPKIKCSLLRSGMHSKPTKKQHTGGEIVLKKEHWQHPSGECSTGKLDGKDTKPEEQKHPTKTPLKGYFCGHDQKGYCGLGDDCAFGHFCSNCGGKHARVNCSTSDPMPQKRKLKEKQQQPNEEAVMRRKYSQHQQDKLVMGDFVNFGCLCAKCGGKHPIAECTIVNPDAEVPELENQKLPSKGPVLKDICILYNQDECKVGERCRFRHVCSGCGHNHPWVKCSKLSPTSERSNPKQEKIAWRKPTMRICELYNIKKCMYGNLCRFKHICSKCRSPHPRLTCGRYTTV